ncbi:V(D)J recombination-activating protein 1-like [Ptychodera flava]|uniref:V(D)J recombination-activating protein 1-like n=1 Tax=Ptychodera flava TaxID=63121 RepID=UPI00396A3EA3
MEYHSSCLQSLCRVCSKHIGNNATQADVYAAELDKLYNIKVGDDDIQIHPTKLCKACTSRLQRCRRSAADFQPMQIEVATFVPHQDQGCVVCDQPAQLATGTAPKAKGRPPKRKCGGGQYGGPGRGHKKSSSDIPLSGSDIPSTSSSIPSTSRGIPSTSSSSELTVESVKRKLLTIESPEKEEAITEATEITSIPLDRFIEKDIAEHYVCSICQGVPTTPCISPCSHIFCVGCIQQWLANSCACPSCREILECDDCQNLTGNHLNIYDSLRLRCTYSHLGCETMTTLPNYIDHELTCKYKAKGKRSTYGKTRVKQSLRTADRQYCKQKRLKACYDFLRDFCTANSESTEDVLFFLLRSYLYDSGDRERSNLVDDLWSKTQSKMSADECLALRIDNLQTKNRYKAQYDMFKSKSVSVLVAPNQLDMLERTYMPGTARYAIVGEENFEHIYQTPVKLHRKDLSISTTADSVEPIELNSEYPNDNKEFPGPNLAGVRFRYTDAVAKTLEEIEPEISENLKSIGVSSTKTELVLRTFIKDGSDGMGDVEIHRRKGERTLPANAFRAAFAVVKCEVEVGNEIKTVWDQKNPNSVRCNRPLIEAIAEENNDSTVHYCLLTMEGERELMKNKVMKIDCGDYWRCHYLVFVTSMVDEKLDRSAGGLQGAGSGYPCTLCDCTREEAISKLGSFSITRKRTEIIEKAEIRRVNPKILSQNELNLSCKGVKKHPLLLSEPVERGIDSTHANINLASFFKKVLVREVAEITQWEKTAELKSSLDMAEKRLDDHLKAEIGINPSLMMPGNYARVFFDEKNEQAILSLIPQAQRREDFAAVLAKFRFLKKVYCAKLPKVDYKDDIESVKTVGIEMGMLLIDKFGYARWPNYLHKVIEHTQELIEKEDSPGTIGGISGEGNEAGNKLFRQFRKLHSRKGSVMGGLRDTIWLHWLYSSPKLCRHAEVAHRKNRCSACGCLGHNRLTCSNES